MNCKPGDVAEITGISGYAGMLVLVIEEAPDKDFLLPNGVSHSAARHGTWVLKSLTTPFFCAAGDGMYGVGRDCKLKRLPKPILGYT